MITVNNNHQEGEDIDPTELVNIFDNNEQEEQIIIGQSDQIKPQQEEEREREMQTASVEKTAVLAPSAAATTTEQKSEKLPIYLDKKACLICTHLVGELGRKTKSCTAKKGNTRCPAQFYSILVGVDVDAYIEETYAAIQNKDVDRLISVLSEAKTIEGVTDIIFQELGDRIFEVVSVQEVVTSTESYEESDEDEEEESTSAAAPINNFVPDEDDEEED